MTFPKTGGNPLQDRKESVKRFNEIVYPVLSHKGFVKLKDNGHVMYNGEMNSLVIVTSCPSQTKMVGDSKSKIRKFRRQFGKDLNVYIYYTRDYSEWKDKPVYQTVLRQIMSIKTLSGISTGLSNLAPTLNKIENKEPFWLIG